MCRQQCIHTQQTNISPLVGVRVNGLAYVAIAFLAGACLDKPAVWAARLAHYSAQVVPTFDVGRRKIASRLVPMYPDYAVH